MGGLFGTVLAVLVAVAAGLHTVGTPGSACVSLAGVTSQVDACGVCGGDGTSCSCAGGYLDFSTADANAGLLCHVNEALVAQIDSTLAAVQILQKQLALADCSVSTQANFGSWLATFNAFCSGASCPSVADPNLYSFLTANVGFNRALQAQLR